MLDHTPGDQEKSIYQYTDNPSDHSDDDQSDMSDDSIYIQMSTAKTMAGDDASMIPGSMSQDFDAIENWRCPECPLQDNPSYLSVETIMNS